jgi:dTDP-4-amino-4,6-dideoxygalactose transaminase
MSTMVERVPVLDLGPETERLWDEVTAAIHAVVRSGQFIMGPQVKRLEEEVAAYHGVRRAVAVNSGTDALVIALRAMGIGPGDEVLVPPFTFFATAEAVSMVGATPVFVDVEPDTYNLDVTLLEGRLTPRTRAVVPVHLFGQAVDMDPLLALARRHGLRVLEDAAQSFGAGYRGRRVGGIGDAGALSFFPSKNLGGYGDGGMIVTDDDALAEECAMLRVHGSRRKYYNEAIGYNSRLDEIQAAVLRVKLPHVEAANAARRAAAARYDRLLAEIPGVALPAVRPWAAHVYNQYTVRVADGRREAVKAALDGAGIGTMVYYPVPVHRLPVYAGLGAGCPVSDGLAGEVLSLPMGPDVGTEVQEAVAGQLRRAVGGG